MQKLNITPQNKGPVGDGHQMTLPSSLGRGGVMMHSLQTGFQLSVSDFKLESETMIEYSAFPAVIGFGFCLSGNISSHPAGFKDSAPIRSGQSALFHFDSHKMWETVGTERVIRLNIMMEPNTFKALLEKDHGHAYPALHRLIRHPCRVFGTLTPVMRATLLQILDCPYQGLARDFFLESKALELVAHKLDQLSEVKTGLPWRPGLKKDDVEKTRYAGELMTRDLENPPSVPELVNRVGMCRSRLHRCFREVYGMTPFDYLRHKRLEAAERLLRQGELNVTQAAYTVGYSSLSHFTKAFKQHTGFLPGQCRKKRTMVV